MRTSKLSLLALTFASNAIILAACSSSTIDYGGDTDSGEPATEDSGKDGTTADSGSNDDATMGDDATTGDSSMSDTGSDAHDAAVTDAHLDAHDAADATIPITDAGSVDAAWSLDGGDAAATAIPDIWVVRAGATGSGTALSGTSAATFIDRFSPAGVLLGTIALPTAVSGGNKQFSLSGASTSEGYINRSVDTHYVTLAGYAADVGTASVSGTAAATVPRVIARIDAAMAIDTTTTLGTAYTAGNVRSAVTTDGTVFWTGGNSGTASANGIQYVVLGGSGLTQVAAVNGRVASIYGAQLYATCGTAANAGINSVGTGLPTTAATLTHVTGFTSALTASAYAFVALDLNSAIAGVDTIYLADDDGTTGGIQRWQFVGATWVKGATFTDGVTAIPAHGLTGLVTGGSVTLFATLADGRLVKLVDNGATTATVTTLSTAGTNTGFRGVAFAPQ
ncbi:MAG: hypothetical protein ABIP39_01495 [Polyangiaceae bacterium]